MALAAFLWWLAMAIVFSVWAHEANTAGNPGAAARGRAAGAGGASPTLEAAGAAPPASRSLRVQI
jgi:hypothetical protein